MDKPPKIGRLTQCNLLIEKVKGSVSTVIGLPICEVRECLKEFGIVPKVLNAKK